MADVVAFDSLGTLFRLGRLKRSPTFRQGLHHAAALTLLGEWAPLDEILRALDPKLPERVTTLKPQRDARASLEVVRGAGADAWVLTNGGRDTTEQLLEQGGLRELVAEVHSVEEVRRYKPDAAVYSLLPAGATLVAAHGWDVAGARAAGFRAVWVDREEGEWQLPLPEPELRAHDLIEAARLATRR